MKYIKRFENINNITQQPFYLTKGDILYISDDFAKSITPNKEELFKMYKNNIKYAEYLNTQNNYFFTDEKDDNGYHKSRRVDIDFFVRYEGMYRMNIVIYKGSHYGNKFGKFYYYIGGHSGDNTMHGKNMIRATRECNLKFIEIFYPIVKYIKNFYKIFKQGDKSFFDIIKESVIKKPEISKYGIPDELKDELGHYEASIKYNL